MGTTPMEDALAWLDRREAYTVVQIGAYVGDTENDPLYAFLRRTLPLRPDATAVLVEPVREYYEQLERAYRDTPRVRLENVAIAEAPGERDFYRLGVDPLAHGKPGWLAQLGSLRAQRMTELWDGYEQPLLEQAAPEEDLRAFWHEHRVTERVRCTTLHDLLDGHGIGTVDLLQIDTEGYDYEILRTLDFERLRPRIVNYERVLLQDDEPACRALLLEAGYVLFDWGQDTLCVAVA